MTDFFTFHLWIDDDSENGWYHRNVLATTRSKARYDYYRDVQDLYSDLTFKDFLKVVKCKKVGVADPKHLFTDKEDFERMCKDRNIPFAYQGMKVEVDGKEGYLVGNYGMNLLVWFPSYTTASNCHPWWETRYFDDHGNIIRDYTKKKAG